MIDRIASSGSGWPVGLPDAEIETPWPRPLDESQKVSSKLRRVFLSLLAESSSSHRCRQTITDGFKSSLLDIFDLNFVASTGHQDGIEATYMKSIGELFVAPSSSSSSVPPCILPLIPGFCSFGRRSSVSPSRSTRRYQRRSKRAETRVRELNRSHPSSPARPRALSSKVRRRSTAECQYDEGGGRNPAMEFVRLSLPLNHPREFRRVLSFDAS